MKRADAPVEGAPVAGGPQKVVNNFITNNIHNDNRVIVRVKNDEEARRWIDANTGLPTTNVAMVSWKKEKGAWRVRWVDAATKKPKSKLFKGYGAWEAAVKYRAEAQATEGTRGPGELEFTADGEAVVDCGHCHRTFSLAAYAPEPCQNKQAFATFARCCAELGSADARVAAAAEAALAVMPEGNGNKALRTSQCRGCRDVLHKTRTEGDSNVAACRAARLEIRADMAARGCRDCEEDRDECLECEHVGRRDKPEGCPSILDCEWFARKYGKERGPAEMWKAYRSPHVVVLCKRCHALQPTHDAAMAPDSSTLEDPKAKRKREYREAKTAHNNKRKREFVNPWPTDELVLEPGVCLYCDFRAVVGNERAFDWMHAHEDLKTCGISSLIRNAQSPATAIPRIDAEIDGTNGSGGCLLGCKNCHYYYETLPRSREGTEKWDALMATPVRKRVRV
jgi:hypothetical protein